MSTDSKLLNNNCVKEFLLRIDLKDSLSIEELSNALSGLYVRKETREICGINVQIQQQDGSVRASTSEAPKRYQYVFVIDDKTVLVYLSVEKIVEIHSGEYKSNVVYKELVEKLSEAFQSNIATRIGLRYINKFDCKKPSGISRIFKTPYCTIIKSMLADITTRAVCVQSERSASDYSCNVQFGVANDNFPGARVNNNLLLDIDSYLKEDVSGKHWCEYVSELNHAAYNKFISIVSDRQINVMR